MHDTKLPQARREKLTVQELAGETLVYDLAANKAHCLNEVSALVWRLCDGRTGVAEMARALHAQLGIPPTAAVVDLALTQLTRRGLLKEGWTPRPTLDQFSRRDVLRKLAVAAVALPVIMTLGAPLARAAASVAGPCPTGTCTTVSDCTAYCATANLKPTGCPLAALTTCSGTCQCG